MTTLQAPADSREGRRNNRPPGLGHGLRRALRDAVALLRRLGVDEDDVGLDATAGPKIFSIAAAAMTINRDMVFTYVNNRGEVSSYDAVASLADFG